MRAIRTDLAVEAKELYEESAGSMPALKGVEAQEKTEGKIKISTVKVLSKEGSEAIGKPPGTYVTVYIPPEGLYGDDVKECAKTIKEEIIGIYNFEKIKSVFVAGLGNPRITPDAIGAETVQRLLVTRHLKAQLPEQFGELRSVSAFSAGVLGTTGIESAEIICAIADKLLPDLIIAVDALASRRAERLCCTVQIADTGIVPGSGVGNGRAAINRETMGTDVLAIGVPTVVDSATLAAELLERTGKNDGEMTDYTSETTMMVTPRDIDAKTENMARIIALALNMLLQPGLSDEELAFLLE